MDFNLNHTLAILERTPSVLNALLKDQLNEWTLQNEGGETWNAFDVIGHLIHGEKTDWMERAKLILSDSPNKTFQPFDRFAQFEISKGKSLNHLLEEFEACRVENLKELRSLNLSTEDLEKKGVHPALGETTLSQLLSTWTVHDLNHIAQISRVMAHQYAEAVGPWKAFLGILNQQN